MFASSTAAVALMANQIRGGGRQRPCGERGGRWELLSGKELWPGALCRGGGGGGSANKAVDGELGGGGTELPARHWHKGRGGGEDGWAREVVPVGHGLNR